MTDTALLAGLEPSMLAVRSLGPRNVPSPLKLSTKVGDGIADFVPDDVRILASVETQAGGETRSDLSFEKAGPRQHVYFDATRARAAIVTCGGLCPGINSVIRSLVLELHYLYEVPEVLGVRFGYEGLNAAEGLPPIRLLPEHVAQIHEFGGSMLGVGRGAQEVSLMVDRLAELGIDMLFTVGGDGTLSGAHAIALEAERRNIKLAVVGVPKTIDNDIAFVDQTFGFDTAIEVARQALSAAHTEAHSARNGVGLVKLMGREAGFIAAHASLASMDVNFCLIPEIPFSLQGPGGLLEALEVRLARRGHAVIAIAEGCGLALAGPGAERDASGNLRFASASLDVGPRLRDAMNAYFKQRNFPATIKYIDPSYMIRSVPANSSDNRYCDLLARHAVHAAMAGKTDIVIGRWNGAFTHVPLELVTTRHKRVDPDGDLWLAVTSTTGQPALATLTGP
jgi:6-phosphofructokinase 1